MLYRCPASLRLRIHGVAPFFDAVLIATKRSAVTAYIGRDLHDIRRDAELKDDDMHTILLAEDHDEMRELLHDILTLEGGWNVAAMPSGNALLHTAASVIPDIVLLDIAMPGIDGLETYRVLRARAETRRVPVLFVTANAGRLSGIMLQGPCETLEKPFAIADLVARVTALLDGSAPVQHGMA
jgi:CheY-like chemotaxis protein